MMTIRFLMLMMMLSLISACETEKDTSPPTDGDNAFFQQGEKTATANALTAWDNLGQKCQQVDAFIGLMDGSADDAASDIKTKYKGQSANAFGSGYLLGLSKIVTTVRGKCPEKSQSLNQLEQGIRGKL